MSIDSLDCGCWLLCSTINIFHKLDVINEYKIFLILMSKDLEAEPCKFGVLRPKMRYSLFSTII